MKKLLVTIAASALLAFVQISCSTNKIPTEIPKPSVSFNSISFVSLDLEGITLKCDYAIKNPYPVSLSLAKLAADITCNGEAFTTLTADEGISLSAKSTKENSFNFKIPYDSILNFAKTFKSEKTLPFKIAGNATIDNIPLISSIILPFSKDFDVPVFKPSFSFSSPKVVLPTAKEIISSFTKSGISAVKAASAATSLASGKPIAENLLDNVNMDVKINFNLNVKNEGGADWKYILNSCKISSDGKELTELDVAQNEINSADGTIPLTATINTITAGKFITQIINKSGTNPTFALKSGISFPQLKSVTLPLSCSKEIPLSKFAIGK